MVTNLWYVEKVAASPSEVDLEYIRLFKCGEHLVDFCVYPFVIHFINKLCLNLIQMFSIWCIVTIEMYCPTEYDTCTELSCQTQVSLQSPMMQQYPVFHHHFLSNPQETVTQLLYKSSRVSSCGNDGNAIKVKKIN